MATSKPSDNPFEGKTITGIVDGGGVRVITIPPGTTSSAMARKFRAKLAALAADRPWDAMFRKRRLTDRDLAYVHAVLMWFHLNPTGCSEQQLVDLFDLLERGEK